MPRASISCIQTDRQTERKTQTQTQTRTQTQTQTQTQTRRCEALAAAADSACISRVSQVSQAPDKEGEEVYPAEESEEDSDALVRSLVRQYQDEMSDAEGGRGGASGDVLGRGSLVSDSLVYDAWPHDALAQKPLNSWVRSAGVEQWVGEAVTCEKSRHAKRHAIATHFACQTLDARAWGERMMMEVCVRKPCV